jgi:hypothetical protein
MADAKVTLKPSEQIVNAANAVQHVTAGEMKIGLKKPGVLQQYRIVEIVGDSAKNDVYMAMIMPLLWVVEINGEPEAPVTTKRELEARISRLGEDGIAAIMAQMQGATSAASSSEAAVKN